MPNTWEITRMKIAFVIVLSEKRCTTRKWKLEVFKVPSYCFAITENFLAGTVSLRPKISPFYRCTDSLRQKICEDNSSVIEVLGSLSNHDDDGNKNPTNLHIWQWKTGFLHALHVHFSAFDILKTFSFFLRREMTCFTVLWTTWAYDGKCSTLSSYVPSAGSNLIPG